MIEYFIKNNFDIKNYNIHLYSDNGVSGGHFERPAIKRLLEDIYKKKIDCIIVKDLSRFGRNYIEVCNYLENIFPMLKIRFISINDNYDSKNNNYEVNIDIYLKNIIYSYYLKDLSKKIKTALVSKAKNGDYTKAFAPFGYKKNNKNKRLEIDFKTAHIVILIFHLAYKGYSYSNICKILNNNNISTMLDFKIGNGEIKNCSKKNKIWKANAIHNIVCNEVYIGNTVNFKKKQQNFKGNLVIKKDCSKIIKIENTHPAIIEKKVFYAINQNKRQAYCNKAKAIFAYKLKCGCCDYALKYTKIKQNGIIKRKYYCRTYKEDEKAKCFKGYFWEEDLKLLFFKIIKLYLSIFIDTSFFENYKKNILIEIKLYKNKISTFIEDKLLFYQKYLENIISKEDFLKNRTEIQKNILYYKKCIKNKEDILNKLNNLPLIDFILEKYFDVNNLNKNLLQLLICKIKIYNKDEIYFFTYFKFI